MDVNGQPVIGIDIGINNVGVAVIWPSNNRKLVTQLVQVDGANDVQKALKQIEILTGLVKEFCPCLVLFERPYFRHENAGLSLRLAFMAGSLMTALAQQGVRVEQIMPTEAKQAMIGHTRASKEQIRQMAVSAYGANHVSQHEADALAVALTWRRVNGIAGLKNTHTRNRTKNE